MKKNFVLDTNVLLHDPAALLTFEEHTVVIPIYVIEEIDTFKRDLSELGRAARRAQNSSSRLCRERGPRAGGSPLGVGVNGVASARGCHGAQRARSPRATASRCAMRRSASTNLAASSSLAGAAWGT